MKIDTPRMAGEGYFLMINSGMKRISADYTITELINIDKWEYRNILVKQFNGFSKNGKIYFCNKEDVNNAMEWLEPKLVAVKLRGDI